VKAPVEKALEEKGLSIEPPTLMGPPGELTLVGSPPDVPSSQSSTATTTAVDRIWEPTSCILGVLIGRQNEMIEVAKGVAHSLGSWHNNAISQDYTRVEVHNRRRSHTGAN
jgi:mitochondrial fission protein ELM1